MLIRPFNIAEEEVVLALWLECNLIPPSEVATARKNIHRVITIYPEFFLVGLQDEQIIATIIADILPDRRGWLSFLAVLPNYRRRGYAHAIINAAEKLFRDRGLRSIGLQVNSSNQSAIMCYSELGYVGKEIIMGKVLDSGTNG